MIANELWRADEIADFLKMSKKSVQNRVLNSASFPPARLIPIESCKKPIKRWVPKEVIAWATRLSL